MDTPNNEPLEYPTLTIEAAAAGILESAYNVVSAKRLGAVIDRPFSFRVLYRPDVFVYFMVGTKVQDKNITCALVGLYFPAIYKNGELFTGRSLTRKIELFVFGSSVVAKSMSLTNHIKVWLRNACREADFSLVFEDPGPLS